MTVRDIATVLVAGCMLAAACTSGSANDGGSGPTTVVTAPTADPAATETPQAAGETAFLSPQVADGTVTTRIIDTSGLPPLPDGVEFIGDVFDVGAPNGIDPVEVSLGIGDDDPSTYRLAHLDVFGRWDFFIPSSDEGRVFVETNDFSVVGWVKGTASDVWDGTWNAGDWVVDGFTGRSDPPADCDLNGSDGVSWAGHTGSPGNEFAHVCMRSRDDGRIELAIRSNRPGPIEVIVPQASLADWIWVEGMADWATPIYALLGSNPNSYILGPGRDMTIGYSQPLGALPPMEVWIIQDGVAQAWGEVAGLIDGWSPNMMAVNTLLCFSGDEQSYAETFSACMQNGVQSGIEDLTQAQIDERLSRAYDGMYRTYQTKANAIIRGNFESYDAQMRSYSSQITKTKSWKTRIGGFFTGVQAFIVSADVYTNIALNLWGQDEANLSSVFISGVCAQDGAIVPMSVTGVSSAANMRATRSVTAEKVGELPAGSEVHVFLESVRQDEDRWWAYVGLPDSSGCGWVAADLLLRPSGELFRKPFTVTLASEFVRRARFGLREDLLEATVASETGDLADGVPFDPAWTAEGVSYLAGIDAGVELRRGHVPADIAADANEPDAVVEVFDNCFFTGHGTICYFDVLEDGDVVAVVEIDQYGDGITGAIVTSPEQGTSVTPNPATAAVADVCGGRSAAFLMATGRFDIGVCVDGGRAFYVGVERETVNSIEIPACRVDDYTVQAINNGYMYSVDMWADAESAIRVFDPSGKLILFEQSFYFADGSPSKKYDRSLNDVPAC